MTSTQPSILIIYCGGTIGMVDSDHGLRPDEDFACTLKAQLAAQTINDIDVISIQPLLDSAAAKPQDWLAIIRLIHQYKDIYDGFVVLHGTDTLAYTAAALSLACEELGKAIVVTGAQRPMAFADSDGLENVVGAIHYARLASFRRVGVYFGGYLLNPRAVCKVHAQADQAFATPNLPLWGEKGNTEYVLYKPSIAQYAAIAPLASITQLSPQCEYSQVALCHLTPGMSDAQIAAAFGDDIRAIVLLSYGVGNIPDSPTLRDCLQSAIHAQKLITNCTQCWYGHTEQSTYATGVGKTGVLEGNYNSYEFAYVLSYFAIQLNLARQTVLNQLNSVNKAALL